MTTPWYEVSTFIGFRQGLAAHSQCIVCTDHRLLLPASQTVETTCEMLCAQYQNPVCFVH